MRLFALVQATAPSDVTTGLREERSNKKVARVLSDPIGYEHDLNLTDIALITVSRLGVVTNAGLT